MTIPFRVKKLTKTAKEPYRNRESDLWDLYVDDFCAENLKDTKYNNTELFYNIKGEVIKPSFYNEDVRVDGLIADREINLKQLAFKKVNHHKDNKGNFTLHPQGRILVRTGVKLELPIEYITLYGSFRAPINKWHWEEPQENVGISAYGVADIHPCSNNLEQKGLFIENKIITGGDVHIVAINHGHEPITINKGDKICQMSLRPLYPSKMEIVEDIKGTGRGGSVQLATDLEIIKGTKDTKKISYGSTGK